MLEYATFACLVEYELVGLFWVLDYFEFLAGEIGELATRREVG